jgi:hypothetical protein
MLGELVEQRDLSGVFEGVTVALYRGDGDTYSNVLANLWGTQVLPIGSEAEARETFDCLIGKIIAVASEMKSPAEFRTPQTKSLN